MMADTALEEAVAEIRRLRDGLFDLELHTAPDGDMADRAVNQGVRALLRLPRQAHATVAREDGVAEQITDVIKPRPLEHSLDDYWQAPGGSGPLASTWSDKPHRLLYDLLAALLEARR